MMKENLKHIKFKNKYNPKANFDLIRLEQLFKRASLDHSPEQLHLVEFFIILFFEAGQSVHTVDFTNYACEKGTIITVRKNQIHKFFKNESIRGAMLLFTDEFLVTYLENLEAQKAIQLFNELLGSPKIQLSDQEIEDISTIIHRIHLEYFEVNDKYSQGIIRSELHILITKLFRIKSQKEQMINDRKYLNEFIEFQSLVEQHVSKSNKVQYYARMMGCSTKTLNNITRNIVNKSAKKFIDEICIQQIKRLLINTDLSIKEIAFELGFEEHTNFYKYFKKYLNTTPEQFRKNY